MATISKWPPLVNGFHYSMSDSFLMPRASERFIAAGFTPGRLWSGVRAVNEWLNE